MTFDFTNVYKILLCTDKNLVNQDKWNSIDLKTIARTLALERSFTNFLYFLFHANKGFPIPENPLIIGNLHNIKKAPNTNGFKSYTKAANQMLLYELKSCSWVLIKEI